MGLRKLSTEELEAGKIMSVGIEELDKFKAHFESIKYLGKTIFNNISVDKLELKNKGIKNVLYFYFDRKTKYLLKQEVTVTTAIGQGKITSVFSDYRELKEIAIKLPYKMNLRMANADFDVTMNSIKVNVEIDDAIFKMPKADLPPPKKETEPDKPAEKK